MPTLGLALGLGWLKAGGSGLPGGSVSTFLASLNYTLTPIKTLGSGYNYDRTGTNGTITDFEGLVKNVLSDEVMIDGARRVENVIEETPDNWSTKVSVESITSGIDDPEGGTAAYRIEAAGSTFIYYDTLAIADGTALFSCWIRSVDSSVTSIQLSAGNGAVTTVPVTTEWQRVVTDTEYSASTHLVGIVDIATNIVDGDIFDIAFPMYEFVDGSTVGLLGYPSEYVSVGVGTGSELHEDPSIDDYTNWTLDSPSDTSTNKWKAIDGGLLIYSDGVGAGSYANYDLESDDLLVEGHYYAVNITIADYNVSGTPTSVTAGCYLGILDVSDNAVNITGNGVYTILKHALNVGAGIDIYPSATISCTAGNTAGFTITDISVKEIDHGSNVDGVKYFETQNANTVTSNVVNDLNPGDPITEADMLGVGVWESRTNVILQSEFDASAWVEVAGTNISIAANTVVGPEGKTTACRIERDTAGTADDLHLTYPSTYSIVAANDKAVFSVYAKAGECTHIGLDLWHASFTNCYAVFALDTPAVAIEGSAASAGIEAVGTDGWYRCWITNTATSAFTLGPDVYIGKSDLDATFNSNLTLGDGLSIWGASVEHTVGEDIVVPSPYIPTTTVAVTRPDILLDYGVENYSDEGTIVIGFYITQEWLDLGTGNNHTVFAFQDASTALDYFWAKIISSSDFVRIKAAGTTPGINADTQPNSLIAGYNIVAVSWVLDEATGGQFYTSINGSAATLSASYTLSNAPRVANVDSFTLGHNVVTGVPLNFFNGNIKVLEKFDEALDPDELTTRSTL